MSRIRAFMPLMCVLVAVWWVFVATIAIAETPGDAVYRAINGATLYTEDDAGALYRCLPRGFDEEDRVGTWTNILIGSGGAAGLPVQTHLDFQVLDDGRVVISWQAIGSSGWPELRSKHYIRSNALLFEISPTAQIIRPTKTVEE